ncbi:nicotinate-nucleotide adenylyltransferase [Pseudoduganella lurida]|uniref:Probable nicotinate-nucleotide adenylyltransferase n=1 Tax=Pseudoduganella lurida TaxID=1036180 RepID=A0A562R5K9_9BURK|nr:nicotinate (nicotinamide) nucleotide adenylyltransferase [Pseudoduganella lurida]TWI64359.1 nicotinate-nucleotide adenylyltransferase [Pseudoduganella lurida]
MTGSDPGSDPGRNRSGNVGCTLLLGGSFDPVHAGHVALGSTFMALLGASELRVIPTVPWQKSALVATPAQRADMAELAFRGQPYRVVVDRREIERGHASYTVETLRELRAELGDDAPLCFLIGADQLARLDTWRDWRALFALAHLCVAARPGFSLDGPGIPAAVAAEFAARRAPPEQLCSQPAGLTCIAAELAMDISSTRIRTALEERHGEEDAGEDGKDHRHNTGGPIPGVLPPLVLDYIEQHKLYKKYN